jgi:hypothetical protein
MITLNFYTIAERRPRHGQELVYLRRGDSFGFVAFEPVEGTAEYCWFGMDEYGDFDGNQLIYEDDGQPPPPGYRLEIMFGNRVIDEENYWWCPMDEYDAAFPQQRE